MIKMHRYVIKRILMMIPVLLGISFIIYLIMSLSPGNPAQMILGERADPAAIEALNTELGFYDPFFVKYFNYISGVLRGDFGISYQTRLPVLGEILYRFPVTLKLAFLAIIIATSMSIPFGVISAVKQYSVFDKSVTVVALIFVAMPVFWLGMILILVFSLKLRWFPVSGIDTWKHFILPAVTLALINVAIDLRMTRSSMLGVIRQDYINTARAKGLTEKDVIMRHALKNALIPVITSIGLNLGFLLGGTIVAESVFGMAGLGSLLLTAIRMKDIPTVTGTVIFLSLLFSIVTLVVDISYGFFDPKIKAQYQSRR